MIPIHELFVGAYVSYNNCTWIVSAIHSPYPNKNKRFSDNYVVELLSDGLISVPIEEIVPIYLTDEWMLRFSFDNYSGAWFRDDLNLYLKKPYIESEAFYVKTSSLDKITSVIYVHQLQSLYQSITGKELTCTK